MQAGSSSIADQAEQNTPMDDDEDGPLPDMWDDNNTSNTAITPYTGGSKVGGSGGGYGYGYSSQSSYNTITKDVVGGGVADGCGLCGLSQLGNTCFMNSALQCLSNTFELRNHFLSNQFLSEINRDNPLGMNGQIAEQFGLLMTAMWSGKYGYVTPRNFKWTLEKFAPQFAGYHQHDSQELLAFLLDGLHEDLNRILKKPYTETPELADKSDDEASSICWELHKKRNDSVIVDLFQGQLKSKVVCPQCKNVSVMFDPFMFLSLPLPEQTKLSLSIVFVPRNFASPAQRLAVSVPKHGRITDLLKAVCEAVKDESVKSDFLLAAEFYYDRVTFYPLESQINERDSYIIYHLTHRVCYVGRSFVSVADEPEEVERLAIEAAAKEAAAKEAAAKEAAAKEAAAKEATTTGSDDAVADTAATGDKLPKATATVVGGTSKATASSSSTYGGGYGYGSGGYSNYGYDYGKEDAEKKRPRKAILIPLVLQYEEVNTYGYVKSTYTRQKPLYAIPIMLCVSPTTNLAELSAHASSIFQRMANFDMKAAVASSLELAIQAQKDVIAQQSRYKSTYANDASSSSWGTQSDWKTSSSSFVPPQGSAAATTTTSHNLDGPKDDNASNPNTTEDDGSKENEGSNPNASDPTTPQPTPMDAEQTSTATNDVDGVTDTNSTVDASNKSTDAGDQTTTVESPAATTKPPPHEHAKNISFVLLDQYNNSRAWGKPKYSYSSYSSTKQEETVIENLQTAFKVEDESYFALRVTEDLKALVNVETIPEPPKIASQKSGISLDKVMELFETEEILGEDDQWYCSKCKEHVKASKQIRLWKPPKILVMHLKRFSFTRYSREKLDTLVQFPLENFSLEPYLPARTSGPAPIYDLFGVSNHFGGLGGGHYTAFCKHPPKDQSTDKYEGKWFHFDDSSCEPATENEVVSPAAYLLFYRRRDDAPSSSYAPEPVPVADKFDVLFPQQDVTETTTTPTPPTTAETTTTTPTPPPTTETTTTTETATASATATTTPPPPSTESATAQATSSEANDPPTTPATENMDAENSIRSPEVD